MQRSWRKHRTYQNTELKHFYNTVDNVIGNSMKIVDMLHKRNNQSEIRHLSAFYAAGQHDDSSAVVLPNHSPEVVFRTRQRTLCSDELAL